MTQAKASISVLDAINGRCSVRSYAAEKLDRTTINALLEAAVRAPTAMDEEPWQFVVIQDEKLLKRLSDRAKKITASEARHFAAEQRRQVLAMVEDPDFNIFYNATTLIAIYTKPVSAFVSADAWLAAENILLAAYSIGLGSCVIGFAVALLNLPDIKAELGIPPELTAIAPLIVGRPAGAMAALPRKAPSIIAWK